MKRTLLVISCVLASLAMLAQGNDMGYFEYIPFVKKGKQWHVVQNHFGYNCRFDHYMINGEVVKNGKTYLRMSSSEDDLAVADDEGLLREEDRKVYFIGPDMQEFLLFDYSLKTGDTYETYSYDHHKMVKYKVLSVEDYTEGPEFICYDYDEKTGSLITHRRYLRKWVVASDIEEELYLSPKTWIEGVGSVEGPLANLTDDRPISSRLFLAYVDDNNGDLYLPFSFQDTTWKQVYGCDLPTGAEYTEEYERDHHHLTYELEGHRLHVYGKAFTQCGPNNYAYFFEEPTDDPLVHKFRFVIQEVEPLADCMALHATDFYVPGSFDPNINYIVVDNQGEEHPVVNNRPYYYYQGNKIPLTLNKNKVVVSVPKEKKEVSERIQANVQTLGSIGDDIYDIYVITRSDYEKLTSLEFWEEVAKSVILTSCYFTEDNKGVCASPYLNVRLKKEEDIDLLTSYAEQYKLTIVRNSPLMPLWYILAVTLESEKSPLECANELYESGNFASSIPDFVDDVFPQTAYRPFVEEGKVWKVGSTLLTDNLVKLVGYYYFDGDTIIDGKTCKQMMCQRYVNPEYPDYAIVMQYPLLQYVGAWYEENKKVYVYDTTNKQFKLMYDFSVYDNALLQIHGQSYVIGPKQSGGMEGFKGVYRDVMWGGGELYNTYNTTWLEGVGGIDGPTASVYLGEENHALFLMLCTVDDEVIYLNDAYEDGATPEEMNAKKHRFDFTHTIKTQPKAPVRREAEQPLYGEYNEQQLCINLNPLDDAYLVRIIDVTGKVVYEKTVQAGNIVGLNIDISNYAEGRYTVTVENSGESFTGIFDTQTTGIGVVSNKKEDVRSNIYNLQGQRISSLRKGLNVVNGRKVYVK